ncbi:MAG: endonuclease/exonuclease/phosphatase family protein [Actinomycetota bacterium]|nr:endonuclease/exonuclease/phosphatase family protein [Actinomycetota bacterium]
MKRLTEGRSAGEGRSDPRSIRFMTFNIRFDTDRDGPTRNRWEHRVTSVIETVRSYDPDVVGFQEALRGQLDDLVLAFPDFLAVGKPRESGEVAEYVPILLDRNRFDVGSVGDFWLSPTPDIQGSRGWDAGNPRHCTWVTGEERSSGFRFAVFNTHLDRWGTLARLEAARLIVARITLASQLPAVVLGDFNAEEDSEALDVFRTSGLRDTFRDIRPEATDVQTVHHYRALSGSRKIDYVMCDARWEVVAADIIREPAAGRLPSDHFPVTAELRPNSTD